MVVITGLRLLTDYTWRIGLGVALWADFYEKLGEISDAEVVAPKGKIYRWATRVMRPVCAKWSVVQCIAPLARQRTSTCSVTQEGTTELDRMRFLLNNRVLPDRSLRRPNVADERTALPVYQP